MRNLIIYVTAALILAGCGASATSQATQIAELCSKKMSYASGVCQCVGEKAAHELTKEQRSVVITMLASDTEEAQKAVLNLPVSKTVEAGFFLSKASAACAVQAMK